MSRRHPTLLLGAALVAGAIALALLSLLWTPHVPMRIAMARRWLAPDLVHWLGTDHFGRDVASMIMAGLRNSLAIAASGVAIGGTLGTVAGLAAATWRGSVDEGAMRLVDFIFAFPAVLAAVVVTALVGPGPFAVTLAIAIANAAMFARLVRAAAGQLWSRPFVRAAIALGGTRLRVALVHVLPSLLGLLCVQAASQFAVALLVEAGLSYLGLGLQPPAPSLGRMLNDSQTHMVRAPWLAIFPGMTLALVVLGAGLLGDGLRDRLDPRGVAPGMPSS